MTLQIAPPSPPSILDGSEPFELLILTGPTGDLAVAQDLGRPVTFEIVRHGIATEVIRVSDGRIVGTLDRAANLMPRDQLTVSGLA